MYGYIPEARIPEIFGASDCIVYPYEKVDQSGALLLGMTLKKAIIASNIGGFNEVLVNGETGLLVAPGDADSLADAIYDILINPEKGEILGQNARKYVNQYFDWAPLAQKTINTYEKILVRN
jgi:glycosyltransferase involved in cell wall biosynthesis